MTLMSEVQSPRTLGGERGARRTGLGGKHDRTIGCRSDAALARLQGDHLGLRVLLDDPVIEDWATEIAGIYQVLPLDVLEALALVLVRDER
jgi:hypothetical protein